MQASDNCWSGLIQLEFAETQRCLLKLQQPQWFRWDEIIVYGARRNRSLLSVSVSAATQEAKLQLFQRRFFQQNQCMANIVRIRASVCLKNCLDLCVEPASPAHSTALL
jgi:hypothetical protein